MYLSLSLYLSLYLNSCPNLNSWHQGLSENIWFEGSTRSDCRVTAYLWTKEKLLPDGTGERTDGEIEGPKNRGEIEGPKNRGPKKVKTRQGNSKNGDRFPWVKRGGDVPSFATLNVIAIQWGFGKLLVCRTLPPTFSSLSLASYQQQRCSPYENCLTRALFEYNRSITFGYYQAQRASETAIILRSGLAAG